ELLAAKVGIDSEALDPAARLLQPEFARAHVRQHETHQASLGFGHLRGLWIAPQVVHHPALPEIRTVDAGDAFVDADDAANIELIERTDADRGADFGHGSPIGR